MKKLVVHEVNTDPVSSDNIAVGYNIGQFWRNTVSGSLFYHQSESGGIAAWISIGSGGGGGSVVDGVTITGAGVLGNPFVAVDFGKWEQSKLPPVLTVNGRLYNWYAVNTGKLAPKGWHVPTHAEFQTLIAFLGGVSVAGGVAKEVGTTSWVAPNVGATNSSGFTGTPEGSRPDSGIFSISSNTTAEYWTSTDANGTSAYVHILETLDSSFSQSNHFYVYGHCVRCIRDSDNTATEVVDEDGNYYTSVTIGTQTWLVQNLATTRYNDGTIIPLVTSNTSWAALVTDAYCNYNNVVIADSTTDPLHIKPKDSKRISANILDDIMKGLSTDGTNIFFTQKNGTIKTLAFV